ncbi:uncharacterized protein L969DRAFT_92834 [Mixia osmundae IAM 14324]|uniref:Uncharacterized protein n=1 Tax=Mixia osmundae (strain CBS 9802 / IAM 14324 / JCM 22182 / KY 12970) TaxID=764103 RepID=G7DYP8_MIXOS|nr:uncharacterized protein L969DRAFT_92834 [Mixia osmundae IAM 14324]KEI41608.1 hypothetical protein L969DRAFT_92834 [Mixia osmundae IAM 14324]GAA95708.1 hypothetical protein E5Q_02365 [Mixia osmundae IAM 14324]
MRADQLTRANGFRQVVQTLTGPGHRGPTGLSLHTNTAIEAKLRWLKTSKASASSRGSDDPDALDVDLSDAFPSSAESLSRSTPKFIVIFTHEHMTEMLERRGFTALLAGKGFRQTSVILDTSDAFLHRMSITDESLFASEHSLRPSERFLIDYYARRHRRWRAESITSVQLARRLLDSGSWAELHERTGEVRSPYMSLQTAERVKSVVSNLLNACTPSSKSGHGLDVIEIAWLQAQSPLAKSASFSKLPGQRFPGLGLGHELGSLFEQVAVAGRTTDGLICLPFAFHNALYYARAGYHFLSPAFEAYFRMAATFSTKHLLEPHGLVFAAWAWTNGHVKRIVEDADGVEESRGTEVWSPEEQVLPSGMALHSLFDSPAYAGLLQECISLYDPATGSIELEGKKHRLELDLEGAVEIWQYSKDPHLRSRASRLSD